MLTKLSRCLPVYLFSVVLISWCGSTADAEVTPQAWPLVRIPDPVARRAAIDALETASARFADADCQKVLTDFEDGNGRSLADQLSSLAVDIQGYLTMVTFMDDSRHARCVSGVLAVTSPGSRVVRVCVGELKLINAQQPRVHRRGIHSRDPAHAGAGREPSVVQGDHGSRARSMRPQVGGPTPSGTPARGTGTRRCCLRAAGAS